MRGAMFTPALLLVLCGNVFGNTGVFAGSGHTLQLIKSADVQMVSEDVTIRPICGSSMMEHSVEFRCTFVLKNRSSKPLKIQVGFPLDRKYYGPPRKPSDDASEVLSYHFIARDAANTYHVRYEAADAQGRYAHIFLWDMEFAASETKTLQVGYLLPMSFAAHTTRKPDDAENALSPPKREKPWHVRTEACGVVFFYYVTETGQSWAGPIEKATFRLCCNTFEHSLRRLPEYVGGSPADLPPDVVIPEEGIVTEEGFVLGMRLATFYRDVSPEGWKPAYIPEIPPGEPKPTREPDGIAWKFENYKPGPPLEFAYYLMGFPETPADCDPGVKCVLGKKPTTADGLELREVVAAFSGVAPQTASVKRLVERQVWFRPQSTVRETELSKPHRAVLERLKTIADKPRE